ncbi:hypothetical protein AVEN_137395-1 [Araneus ventricosus]|uniref:RNase H type-1 domain-containing protein n=1 Tax=Araneus ventricosus TaxID=182803 RepID=A0A4Y2UDY7_ARAVE|nr:hypothetical protein AVEN_207723-1 [Araneus ventricosus]GBO10324.1 hypothetical protein AVEN_137395-1 [Araneus ventricosus]
MTKLLINHQGFMEFDFTCFNCIKLHVVYLRKFEKTIVKQISVYVRETRFGKASHLKDQNCDPKDFEGKASTVKFHPASFDLEDRVSFHHIFNTDEPTNIYTDGSKINYRTDCTFCVRENNISIAQWMAPLNPHNSVFHADLISIKEACTWASQSIQPINI